MLARADDTNSDDFWRLWLLRHFAAMQRLVRSGSTNAIGRTSWIGWLKLIRSGDCEAAVENLVDRNLLWRDALGKAAP